MTRRSRLRIDDGASAVEYGLVITGIAPFATLNNPAPVATALAAVPDLAWLEQTVNVGVAVGLASGIYPAVRAAGLDPIDALRYE